MRASKVQFAHSFVTTTAILILFLFLNSSYYLSLYISAHENTNHSVSGRPAAASAAAAAFIANNNIQNLQPLNNQNKNEREPTTTTKLHAMRAWSCHGKNQRDLVNCLMQAGIVKHESVRDALYRVDRKHYAPASDAPYMDAPQPIGMGQTISAPHS